MNERIRQLAELADEYTDNKIQMPGEYHPDWHDVRDEKFVELIVKECAQQIDVYKMMKLDSNFYGSMLRSHFGVNK